MGFNGCGKAEEGREKALGGWWMGWRLLVISEGRSGRHAFVPINPATYLGNRWSNKQGNCLRSCLHGHSTHISRSWLTRDNVSSSIVSHRQAI